MLRTLRQRKTEKKEFEKGGGGGGPRLDSALSGRKKTPIDRSFYIIKKEEGDFWVGGHTVSEASL